MISKKYKKENKKMWFKNYKKENEVLEAKLEIANKKIKDDNTCQMSNIPKKLAINLRICCFCNYAAKLLLFLQICKKKVKSESCSY